MSRPALPRNRLEVPAEYLRGRAAHYRQLMMKASDPRRANRYREFSQMLEKAADALRPEPMPAAKLDR